MGRGRQRLHALVAGLRFPENKRLEQRPMGRGLGQRLHALVARLRAP